MSARFRRPSGRLGERSKHSSLGARDHCGDRVDEVHDDKGVLDTSEVKKLFRICRVLPSKRPSTCSADGPINSPPGQRVIDKQAPAVSPNSLEFLTGTMKSVPVHPPAALRWAPSRRSLATGCSQIDGPNCAGLAHTRAAEQASEPPWTVEPDAAKRSCADRLVPSRASS